MLAREACWDLIDAGDGDRDASVGADASLWEVGRICWVLPKRASLLVVMGTAAVGPCAEMQELELMPAAAQSRLRAEGEAMLAAGEAAGFRMYCEARRGVLDRALAGMGNEATSRDQFAQARGRCLVGESNQ